MGMLNLIKRLLILTGNHNRVDRYRRGPSRFRGCVNVNRSGGTCLHPTSIIGVDISVPAGSVHIVDGRWVIVEIWTRAICEFVLLRIPVFLGIVIVLVVLVIQYFLIFWSDKAEICIYKIRVKIKIHIFQNLIPYYKMCKVN